MKKLKIISLILLMCCGLVLIYPAVIAKKEYDNRVESYKNTQEIIDVTGDTEDKYWAKVLDKQKIGEQNCMTSFILLISLAVVIEAIGAVNLYLTFKKA